MEASQSQRGQPHRGHTTDGTNHGDPYRGGPASGREGGAGLRSQSLRHPNHRTQNSLEPQIPYDIHEEPSSSHQYDQPPYQDYRPHPSHQPQSYGFPSQPTYHPHPHPDPLANHRAHSDPNEISLAALRMDPDPTLRGSPIPAGGPQFQNPYGGVENLDDRQRRPGGTRLSGSGAASVYSLDSGMGAYGQHHPYQGYPGGMEGHDPGPAGRVRGPSWDAAAAQSVPNFQDYQNNPYVAAASDYLNLPPPGPANYPNGQPGPSQPVQQQMLRHASSASSLSLTRTPTNSIGSTKARRKGTQGAVDVNKPPFTKQFVEEYRARMKGDPDPEAQFAFAKYLIEAARIVGDEISAHDQKSGRKYRDALLAESLKNIKKIAAGGSGGGEGYAEAQFFLANMYGTGHLGLQVDYEKAYQLYMQASKQNHPAATYRTAVCNELGAGTRKEHNRAVLFYRKAATLRDTAAMYKMGMVMLGGLLSQPRNPKEGVQWLRRAAQQADEDNPHALYELAMLHEAPHHLRVSTDIVAQSDEVARDLYTQVAQLGYAPAQFKLGTCFEYGGLGCPIDPRRSIAWFTRAAEKGHPEAELALSGWFLTGAEGILKQSDAEAYLWARKSANKGLAKAEYAVGYYTEVGIGVKQDLELAKRWYMRSAAQNNKQAMAKLAELKKTGTGKKASSARPTRQEASEACVIA